ncbi:MAG: hypothetical protein AAB817_02240 [Patescibacteria group bacterium]
MLSLKSRRIIYGLFIVVFVIVAPLLVLYSAGWRYNWTKHTVVKIGSLSVKPFPRDAKVFLDDVEQLATRTDGILRINNLFPGQYTVKLVRDGYSSWSKPLTVWSSTNTFVDAAVLWKQTTPTLINDATIVTPLTSPNGKQVAGLAKGDVWLINLLNASVQPLTTTHQVRQVLGWSSDSTTLLVKLANGQAALLTTQITEAPVLLSSIFAGSVTAANWSLADPYILYVQSGDVWSQLNTVTKQSKQLLRLPSTANSGYGRQIAVSQNTVYAVRTTATGGTFIERWHLQEAGPVKGPERVWQLPDRGDYQFFASPNGTIILLAADTKKIVVTDPDFTQTLLAGDAKGYQWSADNQRLLIYTDFEIGFYYPTLGKTELVTRYGTTIQRVALFPKYNYLAVLTNNELSTVELDDRDHRTTTSLVTGAPLADFWLAADGDTALLVGTITDQSGAWQLPLQD